MGSAGLVRIGSHPRGTEIDLFDPRRAIVRLFLGGQKSVLVTCTSMAHQKDGSDQKTTRLALSFLRMIIGLVPTLLVFVFVFVFFLDELVRPQ